MTVLMLLPVVLINLLIGLTIPSPVSKPTFMVTVTLRRSPIRGPRWFIGWRVTVPLMRRLIPKGNILLLLGTVRVAFQLLLLFLIRNIILAGLMTLVPLLTSPVYFVWVIKFRLIFLIAGRLIVTVPLMVGTLLFVRFVNGKAPFTQTRLPFRATRGCGKRLVVVLVIM